MTSVPHSYISYGESGSGLYGQYVSNQNAYNLTFVQDQIFKAVG